jgi:hypothetical protein
MERGFNVLSMPEGHREVFEGLDEWAMESLAIAGITEEIAGVYEGVKPAAILECGWDDEEVGWKEGDWEMLEKALGELGMITARESNGRDYYLSKDKAVTERLREVVARRKGLVASGTDVSNNDMQDIEREIGGLLGFPVTSTEAFIGNTERLPYEGRERIDGARHAGLVLSQEHYMEEIEAYTKPISRAVQELMPRAYEDIVRRRSEDLES